ncbi:MAG: 50S ribosomal protein L25 [Rhodothermales bacterium]|nr:50S ribosomal protein L25 [Rhodothermales bacterium]
MNILKLEGRTRTAGKKASREVRQSGNVPCVLYGRSQEPIHFQLAPLEMRDLIYTDEMHRIELSVGKESYDCVMRSVDFHPISDHPIHADFLALQEGQKLKLSVPIQYTGKSVGQLAGGDVEFLLNELEIQCLPKDIPDHIEVDVTHMEIGDTMHVSDLEIGEIEILTPDRQSLVTVVAPRVEEEPEEVEELVGEDGEPLEGEESTEEESETEEAAS